MATDEERIKQAIPAEFHMISGSQDRQTSADVFNVNKVRNIRGLGAGYLLLAYDTHITLSFFNYNL